MNIYVDNRSTLPHADVREVLSAINRQIERDFTPIWGLGARVRLRRAGQPLRVPPDGRVAHVHLVNHERHPDWHIEEQSGIAAGAVMVDLPQVTNRSDAWMTWTVGLSHEVLELIADPFVNLLVKGPHPKANREVFYYREVCDPVQSLTYTIGGVRVSDFVLPHYYNAVGQRGLRNDFLDSGLEAFGWLDQGIVGFWDPKARTRDHWVVFPAADSTAPAMQVLKAKGKMSRVHRYSRPHLNDQRR